ncbi:hypothetical protein B0H66DRAFT_111325 [Apodospora peruviana]|uniref:Flo11 n=1 Tax=Apodospora peruviana TaxID=516989 RepID=A0AAE0MB36_9PEZI|nr:hypothetical protein B0H66DRAFT_111325 [Apodospora peruviana]
MVSSLESAVSRPSSGVVSPPHIKMPSRSRTQSISSDRPSTVAHSFMSPPLSVSPEAAFIASSAASQIVTNDHDSHADAWYDQHGIEPSGETAMVSPGALQLVNNFLDQLLFNFLSTARSTSLSALRPAVSEVLKPKLAKDAINQADEELREYLGGDDEDLARTQDPGSPRDWDLELVWKRARLRCMVYSSLGDMEEEDEDYHMEKEHLNSDMEDRLSEVVSPAVAIFLTSILEFMGEAALVVAGQAAYNRMCGKYEKELKEGARSPADVADRIVVEEFDMERVALDRTLGRLWRAWKKKIRSPVVPSFGGMDNNLSRSFSKDSMRGSFGHLRSPSTPAEPAVPPTVPEPDAEVEEESGVNNQENKEDMPEQVEEDLIAAAIPLPMGENDVDEIEVPGLVSYDDEPQNDVIQEESAPARPKSMMFLGFGFPTPPTPTSQPLTPVFSTRKRSNSLPTPAATPFDSPAKRQRVEETEGVLIEQDQTDGGAVSGEETPVAVPRDLDGDSEVDDSSPEVQTPKTAGPDAAQKSKVVETPSPIVSPVEEIISRAERGPAKVAEFDDQDEDEDEEEAFIEEPQILTSSRISISGRSSSPATSEHGRPVAIITNLPARTPSVHSARLIDVAGPRSPVTISRGSPVDPTEIIRQGNLSRSGSLRSPGIVDDRTRRSPDITFAPRLSVSHSGRSGLGSSVSVSEAEEAAEDEVSPLTPESASLPVIPEPVSAIPKEDGLSEMQVSQPIFGSVNRHGMTKPSSPVRQTTKVTILSSTTTSGSFLIEDDPEPEPKNPVPNRTRPSAKSTSPPLSAPPPTVPERSPSRQAFASAQPSTIGQVSVERSRNRSPSEPYAPRPQEQSSPVVMRQQHTSGSTSTTSSHSHKLKPVRTSEDGSYTRGDVARNFEDLIHSDQTIQYTLTPESMRDMDTQSMSARSVVSGSPIVPIKSRRSEDARQNGERSRSSSVVKPVEIGRSTSISRSNGGLSSHPPTDVQRNNNGSSPGKQLPGVVPRSTSNNMATKSRANGPQARDARMPRESLADFAEFIRSTGPNGGVVPQVQRSMGPSAVRNPGGPVPVSKNSIESGRASTTSNPNRARLQAREAAVDYRDDNSDLIDFIRRGPPSATGGNPRIPRTVAPFRTTMDSDQMSGAVGGKAVDAVVDLRSSQASTNMTEYSSVQSSINSQSALLPTGRNKPLPNNNRFGGTDGNNFDGDMPMPKRKTRRVRDPYAIDLSDEDDMDEDDMVAAMGGSRRKPEEPQEESLLDFLKNMPPPPPEPTPQVQQYIESRSQPKKKSSAQGLMARFARRGDSGRTGSRGSLGSLSPKSPHDSPPLEQSQQTQLRPTNSRATTSGSTSTNGRGYIPIQVNMPPGVSDKYGIGLTSRPPMGVSVSSNGVPSSGRRVPMKKFEPREAVSVPSRGTSELADFFKNSAPPGGGLQSALPPSPGVGDDGGSRGMWNRRKKASVA